MSSSLTKQVIIQSISVASSASQSVRKVSKAGVRDSRLQALPAFSKSSNKLVACVQILEALGKIGRRPCAFDDCNIAASFLIAKSEDRACNLSAGGSHLKGKEIWT